MRRASGMAALVLALSLVGFIAFLVLYRTVEPSGTLETDDLLDGACQVLPYGVVGAVLVARRPDLPFGWLLSIAAASLVLALAITGPSFWALESGRPSELAVWGLSFGALSFVPVALEGVINVRFPSGQPTGRSGRILDRVLIWGIIAVLVGAMLGDETVRSIYPHGPPGGATRFIDDTPVVAVGNLLTVAVPAVILLGVVAGIGVVVRCIRAEGVERKQLQWRAAGVLFSLALFPLAVTATLPTWVANIGPLLFVATLMVPVLRHDLWAIDYLIRRSAAYTMASSGTAVENMLRAVAEMLRVPYVAVQRGEGVLASYGEPTTHVETWPLVHAGQHVGDLIAAPRRGLSVLEDRDRQVLATVAQMVAGPVQAEALTTDLLTARHQLVSAREEERRRLRRDLHDGLGPLLTGLGLNLDAAQSTLTHDTDRTATYLRNAKDASTEVIISLRELVYGLRPPALDDLGFTGALRLHAERIARDAGIGCTMHMPAYLTFPAAVEVAAYRTVVEAMTNVVRHSGAQRVEVTIQVEDERLEIVIADDGSTSGPWRPGVGLASMRERTEELGGTFAAEAGPRGGCIQATYPLGMISP